MKSKLTFFVGPCVIESHDQIMYIADFLKEELKHTFPQIDFYLKGSFDKANRSSISSFRGPGIDEGLKILEEAKKQFQLKTITDFHLPNQAEAVAQVVDVIQIPAFLCRQTDMIVEGAKFAKKYKRILKVKKGQFVSPKEMENVAKKAFTHITKEQLYLTERGTFFGYNNLVVDMTSFQIMEEFAGKVIFDATHSVQMPGQKGTMSGGKTEFTHRLALAAIAAGAQGIFIETHQQPKHALSDPATQYPLNNVAHLIKNLNTFYQGF